MKPDKHTEFDAWAAELYSRDLTAMETVGALCFTALILVLVPFAALGWLFQHIKRDLK